MKLTRELMKQYEVEYEFNVGARWSKAIPSDVESAVQRFVDQLSTIAASAVEAYVESQGLSPVGGGKRTKIAQKAHGDSEPTFSDTGVMPYSPINKGNA